MPLATKMIRIVPIVTTQSSARKTKKGRADKVGVNKAMSEVNVELLR
jgi:hypothetical protein